MGEWRCVCSVGCHVWGVEVIYLSLHCRHHNDSCIKIGTDESHFTVSLIVRDKVRRRCPQATTFLKSSKGGPKRKPVCHAVYVYTRQLKPRVVQKPVCRAVYVYTRQLKQRSRESYRSQCIMLSTCIPDSRSSELYRSQCVMLPTCIPDS